MTTRYRRTAWVLVLIALVALIIILLVLDRAGKKTLLISCTNHANQIYTGLMVRVGEEPNWRLPYLTNQPGHRVLVAYTLVLSGALACNHRNSTSNDGGWQYVNLPPAIWDQVFELWNQQRSTANSLDDVPLFWCGGPTGLSQRLLVSVNKTPEFFFSIERLSESELAERLERLNRILAKLKQSPVSMNIPEGIDWRSVQSWASNAVKQLPNPPKPELWQRHDRTR